MKTLPFRIKICGVTTPDDAKLVIAAGADAIGLNFYSRSKRFVTREQAAAIASVVPNTVTKVGVFVNSSLDEIIATLKELPLDIVQLHGDESPEFVRQLHDASQVAIMRAFRWTGVGKPIDEYLSQNATLSGGPTILIDSHVDGEFGGTGATADWEGIRRWKTIVNRPIVLAGGLSALNVAAAIKAVGPLAVDTASGVESSPGRKDGRMCENFVKAAQSAFRVIPTASETL